MNASKETLIKRSKYPGSKKAKKAIKRLWLQYNTSVSWAQTTYEKDLQRASGIKNGYKSGPGN